MALGYPKRSQGLRKGRKRRQLHSDQWCRNRLLFSVDSSEEMLKMKNAKNTSALIFFALGVLFIFLKLLGIMGDNAASWIMAGLLLASTGTGIYLDSRERNDR